MTKRVMLHNAAWLLFGALGRIMAAALSAAIVARYLGVEQYGLLQFVAGFVAMVTPLMNLAHPKMVVRSLIRDPERQSEWLGTSILMRVAGGGLAAVIGALLLPIFSPDQATWMIYGALSLGLVFMAPDVVGSYFESRLESKKLVSIRTLWLWLGVGAKVALVLGGASILGFAFTDALVGGGVAFSILFVFRRLGLGLVWNSGVASELLKVSVPIIVMSFLYGLQRKLDLMMLKAFGDDMRSVGLFSAASKLVDIWLFLPAIVATTVLPLLVKRGQLGANVLAQDTRLVYSIQALLAIPLVAVSIVMSEPIIRLLFGEAFIPAKLLFQVQSIALIFMFLDVARVQWVVAIGREADLVWFSLVAIVAKAGLNFFLIPLAGALGASISVVLVAVLYLLVIPMFAGALHRQQVGLAWRSLVPIWGARKLWSLLSRPD